MSLHASLHARIVADGPALGARVIDEMYADPWWMARFGERGADHSHRDSDFHNRYLAEAVAANDPAIFANYAVWLRELLVSRGMCSHHLADNFRRIAAAIAATDWPQRDRAIAILEGGAQALVYTTGAAAPLAAIAYLPSSHMSYLADALSFSKPEWFVDHMTFRAERFDRAGLLGELRALAQTVADIPAASALVEKAIAAL